MLCLIISFLNIGRLSLAAIFLTIIALITSYYYTDANGTIYTANLPEDWWKLLLLGLARYGEDYFSSTQFARSCS